jgi:CRP/FNR family cyclic AMP-dependent transcriptional regulator
VTTIRDIEQAFATVPMLAGLSPRQRRRLAMQANTHSFPAGSLILREGDASMALYVVLSGAVRIERAARPAGTIGLDELGPGAVFGEMGVIDDTPRSATVIALERTECALLSRWDLERPLREEGAIALALVQTLSARVRRLEARLTTQPLRARTVISPEALDFPRAS